MALLGAQLVLTLVMISIIQKLGPYFSFGRWLLSSTGLKRYLYPTDSELRQLASIPKEKQKPKRSGKSTVNGKTADTFHIPKSLDIQLDCAKISHFDVVHLRYYSEYQWLIDFSLYAAIVYIVTEVYHSWIPLKDEVNLSMMWCFLVLFFALRLLLSLTVQYFKGEEAVGERSMCIVMGFAYLLIAMIILIIDENTLELGLEDAYKSFNNTASVFLTSQGLGSNGLASKLVLKFLLALWCAMLGALLTFPGLRIAKMHWDLLKYFRDNKLLRLLLNLNFALPFLLVILWIKPVSREYLTVRIFSRMEEPLLADYTFEIMRLVAVIVTMCLRLLLMPWYLQVYLDIAYQRVEEQKKEAGRITNVELQKKIAAVFYYLCVVTLQYVAPLIMCIYLSLMFKTLGGYSWSSLFKEPPSALECPVHPGNLVDADSFNDSAEFASKSDQDQDIHLALKSFKMVFTTDVFRGLFGFATWWSCFIYFATTSIGMVYQTYFTQA